MECHEPDLYSWDYKQNTQFDRVQAIQVMIAEIHG